VTIECDELRQKCLEAMGKAYCARVAEGNWKFDDLMVACLNSLHGIARLVPVEATDEMIKAGELEYEYLGIAEVFAAMSATGDITEKK
jgi:hypothetical protein